MTGVGPAPFARIRRHEQRATPVERQRRGAWYTPESLARQLSTRILAHCQFDPDGLPNGSIIDPSCGAGSFLIAVADELVDRGVSPAAVLGVIRGMDIDLSAVAEARTVLRAWADHHGLGSMGQRQAEEAISLGDHLDGWPAQWADPAAVIGNPPFATPVRKGLFPPAAHAARRERAHWLGPYADLAALHFMLAYERSRPDTVLCMVLPQSLLSSRDTAGLRHELANGAELVDVWASEETYFDAAVRVWAPIFVTNGGAAEPHRTARTWRVPERTDKESPQSELMLSERVAISLGAPAARIAITGASTRVLGDIAEATAGFRDEYYRIVDACDEATPEEIVAIETAWHAGDDDLGVLPIVTSGSIDPLRCTWGRRPSRIAKRVWSHPVLRVERLDDAGRHWLSQQRRPKLLLPTQSKMFEPFIDHRGLCIPVTPVISVFAPAVSLSRIAAIFLAPAIVAHAYRRWYGLALSPNAIKVAARDLLSLPLPPRPEPWDRAAARIDAALIGPGAAGSSVMAQLETVGRVMRDAYDLQGADGAAATEAEIESLWCWWYGRLGAVASLEA